MSDEHGVAIKQLSTVECEEILDRNWFGRLAFALHSRVDIEPLGYLRSGHWLFGRTSHGTKLDVISHQPWVAFEVDEVDGPFDWRSVVAHGVFYRLTGDGSEFEKQTYSHALKLLRDRAPATLRKEDPVPHRTVIFGIHFDSISGRSAVSR